MTMWSHIGALGGVCWCLFCAVYCRRVFGSKMLTELCQNGMHMHGMLQLKHSKYLCFHDMHMFLLKYVKNRFRGVSEGSFWMVFGGFGDLWALFGAT